MQDEAEHQEDEDHGVQVEIESSRREVPHDVGEPHDLGSSRGIVDFVRIEPAARVAGIDGAELA